jgi:hypothetical protein
VDVETTSSAVRSESPVSSGRGVEGVDGPGVGDGDAGRDDIGTPKISARAAGDAEANLFD